MNTSQESSGIYPGFEDTDPAFDQRDLRVFWLAALVAILAVGGVVLFKSQKTAMLTKEQQSVPATTGAAVSGGLPAPLPQGRTTAPR